MTNRRSTQSEAPCRRSGVATNPFYTGTQKILDPKGALIVSCASTAIGQHDSAGQQA